MEYKVSRIHMKKELRWTEKKTYQSFCKKQKVPSKGSIEGDTIEELFTKTEPGLRYLEGLVKHLLGLAAATEGSHSQELSLL